MKYSAIGLMSGSSLDGLDMVLAEFSEAGGLWKYEIKAADCRPFSDRLKKELKDAILLNAHEYLLLHTRFGKYCGEEVNSFLKQISAPVKPDIIGSHGHTTFHEPSKNMTHQLGDGAAIAAVTNISVVSDLRGLDVALNGQGAPIVPIGEKLLFPVYRYFMNIGGICNISVHDENRVIAFDVSPANRVLNLLANELGKDYDSGGEIASLGKVNEDLLQKLNQLEYYSLPYPKSLANSLGTDVIYPIIKEAAISVNDAMATFCEHIAEQTRNALIPLKKTEEREQFLISGGGAFNTFLIGRIQTYLAPLQIKVVVPDPDTINYKEALIMAFMAVLRLRKEPNVLSSVTGANKSSCGGALWQGEDKK